MHLWGQKDTTDTHTHTPESGEGSVYVHIITVRRHRSVRTAGCTAGEHGREGEEDRKRG